MILGLVRLMRRLSLAGYQMESELFFWIHSIIGSGLVSTEIGCDRSRPAHLHCCNKQRGMKDLLVAPSAQIAQ
jgi:hypothetical protein